MNFQDSNNLELTEKEIEKETLPNRDSWTKNSPTAVVYRPTVPPLVHRTLTSQTVGPVGGIVKHLSSILVRQKRAAKNSSHLWTPSRKILNGNRISRKQLDYMKELKKLVKSLPRQKSNSRDDQSQMKNSLIFSNRKYSRHGFIHGFVHVLVLHRLVSQ